jgi:peptide/nickel transport system substrate-binding protein
MRLSAWLPLAALSALAVCGAATRPHYGGTLRVEMRAAPAAIDPAVVDAAPLASLLFETLVRLDEAGTPQPCLAVSWQHDSAWKRWQFHLRPGVKFQDGSPLTAAAVAASLQAALPGVALTATGDAVTIRANHPLPDLLLDLAHNGLVFAQSAEGGWLGTGPFRPTAFEPGRRALFAANDDYWGGRPFLDAIDVQLGRGLRDQLLDLELGKADVVEVGPTDLRRASDHGKTVWSSAAVNLIAIVFAPDAPGVSGRADDPRLREALALSIGRAAMHSVLLQKQGEPTAALLPQWISGYAFAFPMAPDLARARALANALPPAARALTLTYDPSMRAARSLAERVAVNARDAGLAVQVSPQNPRADARLAEVRLVSLNPARALVGLAAAFGLQDLAAPAPAASDAASPAALYESERKLLEGFRTIPLFQLPVLYGVGSRVRVYAPPPITSLGDWRFDNVWLSGTAP